MSITALRKLSFRFVFLQCEGRVATALLPLPLDRIVQRMYSKRRFTDQSGGALKAIACKLLTLSASLMRFASSLFLWAVST